MLKQGLHDVKEPCRYLGGECFRACLLKPCIEAWTLDPPAWPLPPSPPATVPATLNLSHFTTLCLCAISSVSGALPLLPRGKSHFGTQLEMSYLTHPHTSQFLFPRRAGLSHLVASSVPPLFLIQPLSVWIIIHLFKILLPLWISLWDRRLLLNHLSSTSA